MQSQSESQQGFVCVSGGREGVVEIDDLFLKLFQDGTDYYQWNKQITWQKKNKVGGLRPCGFKTCGKVTVIVRGCNGCKADKEISEPWSVIQK